METVAWHDAPARIAALARAAVERRAAAGAGAASGRGERHGSTESGAPLDHLTASTFDGAKGTTHSLSVSIGLFSTNAR